jgi:hypothetical protein
MTQVTTTPVGPNRPKYYNVLVCGKPVSVVRFPSNNLPGKSLQEIAEIECTRILSDYLKSK